MHHHDSLYAALTDWMILGAKTGARKSKWCQDKTDVRKGRFALNVDNSAKAFIASDWTFRSVPQDLFLTIPTPPMYCI